jgi:hypothetical protein
MTNRLPSSAWRQLMKWDFISLASLTFDLARRLFCQRLFRTGGNLGQAVAPAMATRALSDGPGDESAVAVLSFATMSTDRVFGRIGVMGVD